MVQFINEDLFVVTCIFFAISIVTTYIMPKTKYNQMRRIPAIDAILEAVRVSAETGRPLLWGPGSLYPSRGYIPAVNEILKRVAQEAGPLGVRIISTTALPQINMMTHDYLQEGYTLGGHPEMYRPEDVHYLPGIASLCIGTIGLMKRHNTGAHILIGAHWWATGMPIYEAGAAQGAFQVGGEGNPEESSECCLACDYVTIMEETLAAGAYLSGDETEIASNIGADFNKLFLIVATIIGIIAFAAGVQIL
jgi:hypothetical protein